MARTRGTKRILVVSDLHSGHKSGCSPKNEPWWGFFKKGIDSFKPIDICVCNGDMIEGKGMASGGTELLTSDRNEQCDMAIECLQEIGAKQYLFTYGTPYHAGHFEDWEVQVAKAFKSLGAVIKAQLFLDVNGLIFHFKHFAPASSVPHGMYTALARGQLWNLLWAEISATPRAQIIVRSHRHGLWYCGSPSYLAMTTPACQGWGTKFGERLIERTIDIGVVFFEVTSREDWSWDWHVSRVTPTERPTILVKR
jgi:hypothetical protein